MTVNQGTGTETIEVPISIAGNTGILGMTLTVAYGDGLTLTNVVKGDALSSLTFTKPGNFSSNPVNLVWDGEADADTANGVIATLTFTVPKGTTKEYPITLTTKGVFDDSLDDVTVTTKAGKITVAGDEPAEPDEPVVGSLISAPEMTINQGTGTETVEVPISISGNTGILGMTLTVAYGDGLTLTNVVKGDALSSLTFTKPGNFSANPVNLVWDGEADADIANGVIATLTFTVPKGTAKEYPITLTTKGVFDDNLDDVSVTTRAGKISTVRYTGTQTIISECSKIFTVDPINVENGKIIILALYKDGQFIEMQYAVNHKETIVFTTNKAYSNVKVMVWDSLANLNPICDVEIVK